MEKGGIGRGGERRGEKERVKVRRGKDKKKIKDQGIGGGRKLEQRNERRQREGIKLTARKIISISELITMFSAHGGTHRSGCPTHAAPLCYYQCLSACAAC